MTGVAHGCWHFDYGGGQAGTNNCCMWEYDGAGYRRWYTTQWDQDGIQLTRDSGSVTMQNVSAIVFGDLVSGD